VKRFFEAGAGRWVVPSILSTLLAFAPLGYGQPAARNSASATPSPRPAQIDRNGVIILIRTTMIALQQANQTNNYSVLYGISAPGFQSLNPPDRLSKIFADLRGKGFDLSAIVVLEPQLTVLPELYSNGVMRMVGFFPSAPMQIYFDLQFIAVQGQWRIIGMAVDVKPATPVAPIIEVSRAAPDKPPKAEPAASAEPTAKPKG
jgi:hypothetical protein